MPSSHHFLATEPWAFRRSTKSRAFEVHRPRRPGVEVLPYLGRGRVTAPDRVYRVEGRPKPGWYRFSLAGAQAIPCARVDGGDLSGRPEVHGHVVAGRLVDRAGRVERLGLMPPGELPVLCAAVARRWHGGELLFEQAALEGDIEERLRERLERGDGFLSGEGASRGLRRAFAMATVAQLARQLGLPFDLALALRAEASVLAAGVEGALPFVLPSLAASAAARAPVREAIDAQIGDALGASGASLLRTRRLGHGLVEVRFDASGDRVTAIVDASTLAVVDPGLCLGADTGPLPLSLLPLLARRAREQGRFFATR